ncbi:MAG: FAD-dependent monooxygenase [Beijerinckiaceae bacterium]|nr:FAD-dependent monooxygenase [Beijerinckiaceae bacterium]
MRRSGKKEKRVRSSNRRIAIIGAGIGGLTLALALRERGIEATIYEQAAQLTEIGAAIALSANGTRELERLGCLPALAKVSTEPTELIYRNWADDRRVAAFPVRMDGAYRKLFGAPYFGIHRADLQTILSAQHGGARLHLGHRLERLVEGDHSIRLHFSNGHVEEVDVVIGADGVRSAVRRHVAGSDAMRYSRTSAFRGIVPIENLPSLPDPEAIQFWMGPNAHLLHYAIGGERKAVNYFAVVEGPEIWPQSGGSTARIDHQVAVDAFKGWHPAVSEMIGAVEHTIRWGLFTVNPILHWFKGRAVLMGDSVHAMLPHHGQGANTTIEDAVTLAELLARADMSDLAETLALYQALRQARTRKIQRSAWDTNRQLHLVDGPELAERDRKVARFADDFSWIHAHDALQTVKAALAEPRLQATG